jgi:hypothetical protein
MPGRAASKRDRGPLRARFGEELRTLVDAANRSGQAASDSV